MEKEKLDLGKKSVLALGSICLLCCVIQREAFIELEVVVLCFSI